jgi:hypothetical protein
VLAAPFIPAPVPAVTPDPAALQPRSAAHVLASSPMAPSVHPRPAASGAGTQAAPAESVVAPASSTPLSPGGGNPQSAPDGPPPSAPPAPAGPSAPGGGSMSSGGAGSNAERAGAASNGLPMCALSSADELVLAGGSVAPESCSAALVVRGADEPPFSPD